MLILLLALILAPTWAQGQVPGLDLSSAADAPASRPATPLPTIVIPVATTAGVPAQSCDEALAEAAELRKTRPVPPVRAEPVRPPVAWPSRPQKPEDDGVTGRPRISVTRSTLAASTLPGQDPASLPLQPLEGRPEDLAVIGDVLRKAASGQPTRITVFGASHTGGDMWTGRLRRILQDRYGDRGHGFIMPAALYAGDRGQDVNLCRTDGWTSDWVGRNGGRDDGLYGFGASVSSSDPADFGWIQTTTDNPQGRAVSRYQVFTLGEPQGGTLLAQVDDAPVEEIVNSSPDVQILRHRIEVPDGPHRLSLRPMGNGEVRIFGVSAERDVPGVIVDAIGIRGRTARTWLRWDTELSERAIASLAPDMIVLAYGTNEGNDLALSMDDYRTDLRGVLDIARRAAPGAACVLVGPSDRGKKVGRDSYVIWDRTAAIAQVQREVAPEFGCASWDWQQVSGGPGSQIAWSLLRPAMAASDLIHFTQPGYEFGADRFLMALEKAAVDSGGLPGPHLLP